VTLPVPHLRAERRLWRAGRLRVCGVDEVGMGALCAPVVAAAVLVRPNCHKIPGVRDSKTLSAQQRERVVGQIKRRVVAWGVGAASVSEIERLNIYHASHLAMRRALARIDEYDHVLVDGRKIVGFEQHVGPYTSIVDGDASSYAIACASIIAKVTRDRLMARLALRYPGYGWEHNAGYTTRAHVAGLRDLGLTPHHRRTYARIRGILEGNQLAFELLAGEGGIGDEIQLEPFAVAGDDHVADGLRTDGLRTDGDELIAIPIEPGTPVHAETAAA
jgi:ribonuclease HII